MINKNIKERLQKDKSGYIKLRHKKFASDILTHTVNMINENEREDGNMVHEIHNCSIVWKAVPYSNYSPKLNRLSFSQDVKKE